MNDLHELVRIVVAAVTISADCELSRQILQLAIGETTVLQSALVVTAVMTNRIIVTMLRLVRIVVTVVTTIRTSRNSCYDYPHKLRGDLYHRPEICKF
jgi:uncharacterized Tic20 family protein